MTFTEKGQTASPTVTVTDSENNSLDLTCPTVKAVNSKAPDNMNP